MYLVDYPDNYGYGIYRGTNTGITNNGSEDTSKDVTKCVTKPFHSICGAHCGGQSNMEEHPWEMAVEVVED